MPRKHTYTVSEETCFPCKYWRQILYKSGQHPIYHRYCDHPASQKDRINWFGGRGRLISETSDLRPNWCPLTLEELKTVEDED